MSFTFGFYNSIEHDRLYDAIQVSKIFDGILLDGVYETIGDAFIVQASTEPNLVVVGPGRAWFHHTWNENDGYLDLELDPPETILQRIDAVVIDIDERIQYRKNDILVVKGTASSTPTKPTLISTTEHHQYPLCYILRAASETTVSQTNITNTVGTTECPFVTGVLEGIDTDLLLLQWQSAWTDFLEACQDHIDEWEDAVKTDIAAFIAAFKTQCNDFLAETDAWQTEQKASFQEFYNKFKLDSEEYEQEWIAWVNHLKDILDQDAIGNMILEMEQLKEDVENQIEQVRAYLDELISGFQAKKTQFLTNGDIVQTFQDGSTITTVFLTNGDIEETLRSSSNVVLVKKLTEFKANGDIEESVIGGNYPEFALSRNDGVGEYINTTYNLGNPAFNNLASIRDVANSQAMMTAIIGSESAWANLSLSPTAMNAFLGSDVALGVMASDNDILEDLLETKWDVVVNKSVVVTAIISNRTILKFIFDDETMQEKFWNDQTLMHALITDSTLRQNAVFGECQATPVALATYTNSNVSESAIIKDYTWAIFFDHIWNGRRGTVEDDSVLVGTEFFPLGNEQEDRFYWRFPVNENQRLQAPILVDISEATSSSSSSDGQIGSLLYSVCIAF